MFLRTKSLGPPTEREAEAGEHGHHVPGFRLVPAVAATVLPDGALHLAVNLVGVGLFGICSDLDRQCPALSNGVDGPHDVLHLRLDEEDRRGVPDSGVGPGDDEEVGEAGNRGAEVRARVRIPDVGQGAAVSADHRVRDDAVGGVVSGGPHQEIDVDVFACGGDDSGFGDLGDTVVPVVQGDVRLPQRRIQRVGQQHSLTADGEVRGDLGSKLRIRNLRLDVFQSSSLGYGFEHSPRVLEPDDAGLEGPVDAGANRPSNRFHTQQLSLERREFTIVARHHPVRGALKDVQMLHIGLDRGDHLCGAGTAADDRHPLTGVVVFGVPVIGVKLFAAKRVSPRKRRNHRRAERTRCVHDERGRVVAARGGDRPVIACPFDLLDVGVDMGTSRQTVRFEHVVGVPLEFLAFGEHTRPLERFGRDRVQRTLHVDGCARISVLLPRAAEEGTPLEDYEVVDPTVEQSFGCALATEAAADDDHIVRMHPQRTPPTSAASDDARHHFKVMTRDSAMVSGNRRAVVNDRPTAGRSAAHVAARKTRRDPRSRHACPSPRTSW